MSANPNEPILLTPALLREWSLPQPDDESDKEGRGRVLIVGGSPEMPGSIMLAATAALRAGAGKLRIATGQSIAQLVAVQIPEGRVFSLPETAKGGIDPQAAEQLAGYANQVQAVLIGPGMVDNQAVVELLAAALPKIEKPVVILDAAAFDCLNDHPNRLHHLENRAIITPHAGELAHLLGIEKAEVQRDPAATAQRTADTFRTVVALKGAETLIAAPNAKIYANRTGNVGLATSGSGDTLSGIVAGLAARGAEPQQATAWAVYLHGSAGDRLAARMGRLGFLARELLAEIPPLMAEF